MFDVSDHLKRVTRAEQLGAQLADSIQAWAERQPWGVEGRIADDRLSWTLRLKVNEPPPLEDEWNFLFGDAVHNLRSSLDNMVVAIARLGGISEPKLLKQIAFPIAGSRSEWKDSGSSRIRHLAPEFRASIESVQPYQRGEDDDALSGDLLLILRDLSNQDKHHIQVKAALAPASLEHSYLLEFESEADAAASIPPDTEIFGVPFEDGATLLHHRTKGRIAKVKGGYELEAQAQIVLPNGRQEGLSHLLAGLCIYTKQVMMHVATSKWFAP